MAEEQPAQDALIVSKPKGPMPISQTADPNS
jgi:hypothetical protein